MKLIGFPTLIAGLILLTAGSHWFQGAHTVGLILTIVSGAAIIFGLVLAALFGLAVSRIKELQRRR